MLRAIHNLNSKIFVDPKIIGLCGRMKNFMVVFIITAQSLGALHIGVMRGYIKFNLRVRGAAARAASEKTLFTLRFASWGMTHESRSPAKVSVKAQSGIKSH